MKRWVKFLYTLIIRPKRGADDKMQAGEQVIAVLCKGNQTIILHNSRDKKGGKIC